MTAGPGDEKAASAVGRGHLRASHADREQVIGTLKAAFIQGRLAKGELDLRVGQALASRTYAELAALTADIPAGLADAVPPGHAPRPPMSNAAKARIWVAIAMAVPVVMSLATGGPLPFFIFTPFYLMVAVVEMHARRLEKRSGGHSPRLPGHRRRAVEGEQSSRPGNDLILCQAPRDTRARRLLGHSVTQRIWRSVPTRRASAGLCT